MQRQGVKAKHGRNMKPPEMHTTLAGLLDVAINLTQGFLEGRREGMTVYS